MSIFQALVLGAIQGITEFLPISSSAHLIFLPKLFGWKDQGLTFDTVVHLGTLLAVVLFFRHKLWSLLISFFSRDTVLRSDRRLAWFLLVSVIPAGALGIILEDNRQSAVVIGVNLILWGILLGLADWYNKQLIQQKTPLVDVNHLTVKHVFVLACAQAAALIPGTSRSGITMTTGLFLKLDRTSAAEFSFLMSVPIIAMAGLFKGLSLLVTEEATVSVGALLSGFLASFFCGFVAIAFLMSIIKRWSFLPFVIYRIAVGVLILLVLV
ncbi:MAG TPA: undecaprenyl-diphosphate phosphatase [Candidatus Kapabacteria bacterium]|nr:undecaprenyl-diphosphate phosphatase [Candidatus Kapabacteria bacterium]